MINCVICGNTMSGDYEVECEECRKKQIILEFLKEKTLVTREDDIRTCKRLLIEIKQELEGKE